MATTIACVTDGLADGASNATACGGALCGMKNNAARPRARTASVAPPRRQDRLSEHWFNKVSNGGMFNRGKRGGVDRAKTQASDRDADNQDASKEAAGSVQPARIGGRLRGARCSLNGAALSANVIAS